jgi:hypothetical protein
MQFLIFFIYYVGQIRRHSRVANSYIVARPTTKRIRGHDQLNRILDRPVARILSQPGQCPGTPMPGYGPDIRWPDDHYSACVIVKEVI